MFFTEQLPSFDFSFYDFTIDVNHLTNRLDIAVRLFSNRSKITSKNVKNKEVAKSQTLLLVSFSCFFFFSLSYLKPVSSKRFFLKLSRTLFVSVFPFFFFVNSSW